MNSIPWRVAFPSWLCLLGVLVAPAEDAFAQIPSYGPSERLALQEPMLAACRAELDLNEMFPDNDSHEFTVYGQAEALICELEAWRLGLFTPPDEVAYELALNTLMQAMLGRLGAGLHEDPCGEGGPAETPGCLVNIVIARMAGHMTAYVLNRYTECGWDSTTRQMAGDLYRDTEWTAAVLAVQGPGNSFVPLVGMKLLGGEALDDEVLRSRGIAELYYMRDREVRHGIPEPMARHYAGVTLGQLQLLRETDDPALREIVDDLLAAQLLVSAHSYLPGGEAGGPQNRKTGPLDDTLDTSGPQDHLLNHLVLVVNDPDLPSEIEPPHYTLASDYTAPEVIRSIFLDKGEGYTFWMRGGAATVVQNGAGYEGERHYPSYGWQGFLGNEATAIEANPWQSMVLRGGAAQMGIMYAAGTDTDYSNAVFARDAADAFSICYHHQPRPDPGATEAEKLAWDPLEDDPQWRWEAHTPYRRMMYGHVSVTLFEPNDFYPGLEHTIAHLPGWVGAEITDCGQPAYPGGNAWLVARHLDAWVGFLPLGPYSTTQQVHETRGNWTYLEFGTQTISGNVIEMHPGFKYADAAAYCSHLPTRNVAFDPAQKTVQLVTPRPGGGVATIALDYANDQRLVDGVPQADDGFIDRGLLAVEPNDEPTWLHWMTPFQLKVYRPPYEAVHLDWGEPTHPTAPQILTAEKGAETDGVPVRLEWRHGWDDQGIVEYRVYRDAWGPGDAPIGTVRFDDPGDPFAGESASFTDLTEPNGPAPRLVEYRVQSVDAAGNTAPVLSMIAEASAVLVPPAVATITSAVGGVKNVTLDWTPATDNWEVVSQQVLRDDEVIATVGAIDSHYVDGTVLPNRQYEYSIRATDRAGLVTDGPAEPGTTPADTQQPSAPTNVQATRLGTTGIVWWEAATDDWGIYGYRVRRHDEPGPGTFTFERYFWEPDLAPGTYTYSVSAIDWGANQGPEAPAVQVTIP